MKTNGKLIGLVFSLVFAGGTIFGFFWLWNQLNSKTESTSSGTASQYQQIEVSSVKKEADDILAGKQKIADIPVKSVPSKEGRDNPFADVK